MTEAGIDGFCRVWYDGIVGHHGSCGTDRSHPQALALQALAIQHVYVEPWLSGVPALTSLSSELRYERMYRHRRMLHQFDALRYFD